MDSPKFRLRRRKKKYARLRGEEVRNGQVEGPGELGEWVGREERVREGS